MSKTMLFNPYTGKPRDPRDIASDPAGILMLDPDEPLRPAQPAAPAVVEGEEPQGLPYGIVDPDYARVFTKARCLAWSEGYALALHGSFTRDLDLVAIPWAERCCEPAHLIRRIEAATGLKQTGHPPGTKPHGRRAWTLLFSDFGDPRFVDVSILATSPVPMASSAGEPLPPMTCKHSNRSDCAMFESKRPSPEWYARKIKETEGLDEVLPRGAPPAASLREQEDVIHALAMCRVAESDGRHSTDMDMLHEAWVKAKALDAQRLGREKGATSGGPDR